MFRELGEGHRPDSLRDGPGRWPLCTAPIRELTSVPDVALVVGNSIFREEGSVLLLERMCSVVLFLAVDVEAQSVEIGRSNGERTVAPLPRKVL